MGIFWLEIARAAGLDVLGADAYEKWMVEAEGHEEKPPRHDDRRVCAHDARHPPVVQTTRQKQRVGDEHLGSQYFMPPINSATPAATTIGRTSPFGV